MLAGRAGWNGPHTASVMVDGYHLLLHCDGGHCAYVECAISPDGRITEYVDWSEADGRDPIDLLNPGDRMGIESLIEASSRIAPPCVRVPCDRRHPADRRRRFHRDSHCAVALKP